MLSTVVEKPAGLKNAIIVGIMCAIAYCFVSAHHIERQGLYYDELFQATASFWYVGKPQTLFSLGPGNFPALNMSYNAAFKTALYGLYLKFNDGLFSVRSWRLTGIAMVAAGILAFSLLTANYLSIFELLVFFTLVLTDTMVLLSTRHDWGPVALALSLRFIIIGLTIRAIRQKTIKPYYTFFIAFFCGIAIVEKLTSCVLLLPLGFLLIFEKKFRNRKYLLVFMGGLFLGSGSLILLNAGSLILKGYLISLHNIKDPILMIKPGIIRYITELLGLGNGSFTATFIFGSNPSPIPRCVESVLLFGTLIAGAYLCLCTVKEEQYSKDALLFLISFILTGIGLYLLPRTTSYHHWILITPYQYAGIAILAQGALKQIHRMRFAALLFLTLLCALLLFRIPVIASMHLALKNGKTDPRWDPSLTQLGKFAGRHAKGTTFITADWGVGTQILCLSNGAPNILAEAWGLYATPAKIDSFIQSSPNDTFYLVIPRIGITVADSSRRIIINTFNNTIPGLCEVMVEPEAKKFNAVILRKFIRQTDGCRQISNNGGAQ
ncbi:MAG: hypothetical protein A2268_08990 [Candidatus Raymondbacteria bacterium RifOxyA12_full_50_37]|uniref:Glycosyltransferase RgtA/B/C/D-like domain-containing protein n=1 Tax=Candidatus Raymondbacteria bacterium RIFOXYD12_FULL_49_13 TaxID=1817890 RepID=A0A1F7FG47_UNCRA|nr:MAG: hypothetical protein A2268_08990 [Candidatus Raymondbacteria bacterium RifOxyA12_full_50_37]OGJ92934.1 MAG: hypothetical protein A2248_08690 [Candidatus Raymondbacteria bacterium RIFOXYA2_FULL_49_16]OGK01373.1 MAG: hypothetical protein A2350_19430 [Candidatus Raymondbacteria bacterium RifOxyB12_full_50_8]OGK03817.1 MAG: hypothetical protein A2487_04215 [Candidatus Raymondbacteria bacterium RifOxyC12_full_50_8]OGK05680.1 MAG: hypothetical protein A2519_03780 [Candidatus Raymondbacteria b